MGHVNSLVNNVAGMWINSTNAFNTTSLRDLNDAERRENIPIFAGIAIIGLLGIIGNSVVFHVYRSSKLRSNSSSKRRSNSQWFIICLAATDLFSCSVSIPLLIATEVNIYEFEEVWLCRSSRLFAQWPSMSSAALLLVIATERFRKVCRPKGWQIEARTAKILSVLSIASGLVFSWPIIPLYGKKSFEITKYGQTGTYCSISDSMSKTMYPLIYQIVVAALVFGSALYMCILYCIVAYATRLHANKIMQSSALDRSAPIVLPKKAGKGFKVNVVAHDDIYREQQTSMHYLESITEGGKMDNIKTNKCDEGDDTIMEYHAKDTRDGDVSNPSKQVATLSNKSVIASNSTSIFSRVRSIISNFNWKRGKSRASAKSQERNDALSKKITLLMIVVSIAFVVSYVPHVILMLFKTAKDDFVENMSEAESKAYFVFIGSFFLNYVSNPVIYGVCDSRFRKAINKIFFWRCNQANSHDPNYGF